MEETTMAGRFSSRLRATAAAAAALAAAGTLSTTLWAQTPAGAPIKIGVLTALSGAYVPFGQPLFDGVRLAVEEVNAQGGVEINGVKHPVQIVERDTRSDVNTAVTGVTALVRDSGVKFVIGPATGIETSAAQEITQRAKVIHMTAASNLQGVLTKENTAPGGNRRHLFMTQAAADTRERATVKASLRFFGNPKLHAVIISNDSNGDFIGKKVVEAIEQTGAKLALPTVLYEPGTTDYSSYLTKIKAAKADHLHVWWLPTDGINILQQARQLEAAQSYFVFGLEPVDVTQRLGTSADRVLISCSPICRSITTTPESKDFWERYTKLLGPNQKFGAAAGGAAWYYEATRMLLKAMQDARSTEDTEKIATALADVKMKGPLGTVGFNERHIFVHGYDFCLFTAGTAKCEHVAAP